MTSSILFAGQEDLSFSTLGQTFSVGASGPISIDTTAGRFRSGYARYAITIGQNGVPASNFVRASFANTTSFWTTARNWGQNPAGSVVNAQALRWCDSGGVVRLRIRNTSNTPAGPHAIEKVNAAGTATQLGSNVSIFNVGQSVPDKIDIFINYNTSGQFTIYLNGTQIFSFSGDVTTDGQTTLGLFDLGETGCSNTVTICLSAWSEVIIATRDTRNMSLVTLPPGAPGNSSSWTSSTSTQTISSSGTFSGTYAGALNTVFYSKVTSTYGGQLTSIAMSLNAGLTGNIQMALYSDNGGSPSTPLTRLALSGTVTNPTSGTQTFSIAGGPSITSNTVYWVAFVSSANYTANQTNGTSANFGATQASATLPSSAAGVLTTNNLWVQMNVATPNVGLNQEQDASPDSSPTALQIQEYQLQNTLPAAGSFSILTVVQHTRATVGSSGPQHIDFAVRTGGSDFFSPDQLPSTAWGVMTYNWDTNPNTTAAWQGSDLPAASTSFNFGYRSNT